MSYIYRTSSTLSINQLDQKSAILKTRIPTSIPMMIAISFSGMIKLTSLKKSLITLTALDALEKTCESNAKCGTFVLTKFVAVSKNDTTNFVNAPPYSTDRSTLK